VHRQQQAVGHILQIRIRGAALRPMGRQVQVIDRAVDVVDVAFVQHRAPFRDPIRDDRLFLWRQHMLAMGFHVAVADVHDRDLVHLDPALPVLGRDPKHRGPVFTNAEIIVGQVGHGEGRPRNFTSCPEPFRFPAMASSCAMPQVLRATM